VRYRIEVTLELVRGCGNALQVLAGQSAGQGAPDEVRFDIDLEAQGAPSGRSLNILRGRPVGMLHDPRRNHFGAPNVY
jgi:hypothetical protein